MRLKRKDPLLNFSLILRESLEYEDLDLRTFAERINRYWKSKGHKEPVANKDFVWRLLHPYEKNGANSIAPLIHGRGRFLLPYLFWRNENGSYVPMTEEELLEILNSDDGDWRDTPVAALIREFMAENRLSLEDMVGRTGGILRLDQIQDYLGGYYPPDNHLFVIAFACSNKQKRWDMKSIRELRDSVPRSAYR